MTTIISKRDYYIRALNEGCYRHKAWVIEAFSESDLGSSTRKVNYPWSLHKDEKGYYTESNPGNKLYIEDTPHTGAPFHFLEAIDIGAGEVPNIHERTETFYGNLLVNYTCLIYAFGDKVDFVPGRLTVSKLEGIIEKRLADTPIPGKPRDPHKLYIDEFKKFNDGVRHLEGFSQLCVPSATKKTMTVSPEVLKRRDQLFKEHAHELHDPLVLAKIDAELVAMDREWIKGDPAERFYIKNKSYDIVRKKMFISQGQEKGFGITGKVVTNSLSEGWNIHNLPEMATALRNGSYMRGSWTALGGVEAKNNYRIFQNTVVVPDDCGTKLGLRVHLTPDMAKHFIASYVIEKDGHVKELTSENINFYVDKDIVVRSPAYCKTPNQNICAICVGSKIAQTPTAISTYASDLGSVFLSLALASFHGKALKSARVSYLAELR